MRFLLSWYLVLLLVGAAALPLGWSWLRHLPDRGIGVLRPLGLLVAGFTLWLLGSLGLLRLEPGSILGVLGVVAATGAALMWRRGERRDELVAWLREHRTLLLFQEALLVVALAFWAWYRVHDLSGIDHTEEPMDFALMRAILRGGELPPGDPWLSGFVISYYYLGYLIFAMVTRLASVPPGVGYNLALASVAALATVGAWSLVYNLLAPRDRTSIRALAAPLLAPLLLLGISNLSGAVWLAYYRGMGSDAFYRALQLPRLVSDPPAAGRLPFGGWWWWEASRTVLDLSPEGHRIEVIDEFPFFSFLLGDLHPHVLALPFALLVLAIALDALRGALAPPAAGASESRDPLLSRALLVLTAIVVGGMAMLNTWDFPTALALIGLAWLAAALFSGAGGAVETLGRYGRRVAALVLLAVGLYLPFYAGFSSQAEGIWLSTFRTLPQHYLLMFGLFWLVLIPLALSQLGEVAGRLRGLSTRLWGLIVGMWALDALLLLLLGRLGLEPGPLALLLIAGWVAVPLALAPLLEREDPTPLVIAQLAGMPLLAGIATQRWTLALIAWLLALLLLSLWAQLRALLPDLALRAPEGAPVSRRPAVAGGSEAARLEDVAPRAVREAGLIFAMGIAAVGLLLTMGAELFYIKDGFPGRMNTVFKLYYQGWLLMSVASAFGIYYLARRGPVWARTPWLALVVGGILISLWYPLRAIETRASFDAPAQWDGLAWMARSDPDRYAAIQWLDTLPEQAVVLEMPGNSYRVEQSALSGWTGHSTLVGWTGHELQWRGSYDEIARREPIIEQIYRNPTPELTPLVLDQWGIDFVAITPNEIARYELTPDQINRFREFMTPVFEQGSVILFGR